MILQLDTKLECELEYVCNAENVTCSRLSVILCISHHLSII